MENEQTSHLNENQPHIMEAKSIRKVVITLCCAVAMYSLLKADNLISAVKDNEFLKELREKLEKIGENYSEDRVYLQFDKPMYEPGDDIWFSAYITDAKTMKPSTKSDVLHVELLSPKGSVEHEYKLFIRNGKANGDFRISEDMPGGIYKVRAYTNWMKNEPGRQYVEKELQVQDLVLPSLKMSLEFQRKSYGPGDEVTAKLELTTNENKGLTNHSFRYKLSLNGKYEPEKSAQTGNDGTTMIMFRLPEKLKTSDALLNVLIDYEGKTESISRSVPVYRNDFKVELYPEGGDLVHSLPSRVAFKVTNEYGKPADIDGVVVNSRGEEMTKFTSFHGGLGAFNITPEMGEKYTVKITKPEGCQQQYDLPGALPAGFIMNIDQSNPAEAGITLHSTETDEVSLIAQVRGNVYYTNSIQLTAGINRIVVPLSSFPTGVAQFTLFDSQGIERAERLVFVNKNKQLNISIHTDKEKYLPREKVKLTITTRDQRGLPVPANLSLSVTNDQLLSMANDKSGNIMSHLFLQPELKAVIDEPSFYFDPKEPKSDKALDLLLMTSGWRRFTWAELRNDELPAFTYKGEKAVIAGTVLNAYTSLPVKNAEVLIGKKKVATDEQGRFIIKKPDLSVSAELKVNAENCTPFTMTLNDYSESLICYVYDQRRVHHNQNFPAEDIMEMKAEEMEGGAFMNEPAHVKRLEIPMPAAAAENKMKIRKNMELDAPRLEEKKEQKNFGVLDERVFAGKNADKNFKKRGKAVQAKPHGKLYYRARTFPDVSYSKENTTFNREDFRTTVFWNGSVETDRTGTRTLEFYNCDEIASFRITVEGISTSGLAGHQEKTIYTQLPFSMNVKLPVEVVSGDQLSIPLTLTNNTTGNINGSLHLKTPSGFKAVAIIPATQQIAAGTSKTIYLDYQVMHVMGDGDFTASFTGAGHTDSFSKKIKTVAKGFPVMASFSGNEMEKEYEISIQHVVEGSLQASLGAYPSVISDLMKGVESILREPSGCFEQTSVSSYPNVMVMDYLRTTGNKDEKLMASAEKLLDKGYKKLTSYEAKEKGYEWFGASPAHEALTAYGLMQFNDMKAVYEGVDERMINRTAEWLLSRRDGKGGFKRNGRALDNFGAASEEVTNAYIVYALSEAGYRDIRKEYESSLQKAMSTQDPYLLALMSNASFALNEMKNGMKCLEKLCKTQNTEGSFNGMTHSVTRSTGISLKVETSALAVLAMLSSGSPDQGCLQKAVTYLVGSRTANGAFGSTQGTILALKALTAYAKFSKATAQAGTIAFYVDGKRVAERSYKAGEKEAIEIKGLEKFLSAGNHKLKVKFEQTDASLPYSLGVSWNTSLPQSSRECTLDIRLDAASKSVRMGETLRLSATLSNKGKEGLASPIAIIGIPAGFTLQPWQLKELSEKNMFDYYEIKGNSLVLYYRQFAPEEKKLISLDLKAEVPGIYEAPASTTYLYYTNEHKTWKNYERIQIKKS